MSTGFVGFSNVSLCILPRGPEPGHFVARDADVPSGLLFSLRALEARELAARDRLSSARFAEEQVKRREHGGA